MWSKSYLLGINLNMDAIEKLFFQRISSLGSLTKKLDVEIYLFMFWLHTDNLLVKVIYGNLANIEFQVTEEKSV